MVITWVGDMGGGGIGMDANPRTEMGGISPDRLPILRQRLRHWYAHQGRNLPWRNTRDPYEIWVSELMLQQTQVKTVLPYYQRWLERFPTIASLAAADRQTVLKQWEGLGYYRRARYLHEAAQQICDRHGGEFPQTLGEVLALPGIGRTTAGGILSSAFDLPVAILDGNVKRVIARLIALDRPPARVEALLWYWSETLLDPDHPRDFNQALMDLGATLCTPKKPACLLCPWQENCCAYQTHQQDGLPRSSPPKVRPHKHRLLVVLTNDAGQWLMVQRPTAGLLGGLWELPSVAIADPETMGDRGRAAFQSTWGWELRLGAIAGPVDHAYTHFQESLWWVWGEVQAPILPPDRLWQWCDPHRLGDLPLPQGQKKVFRQIQHHQQKTPPKAGSGGNERQNLGFAFNVDEQ